MSNNGVKFPVYPNEIKAVETNIPTLSGVTFGFVSAFFIGVILSSSPFLSQDIILYPLIFFKTYSINICPRSRFIIISCLGAMFLLFNCISSCIKCQISEYTPDNYDLSYFSKPTDERETKWNTERFRHAKNAIRHFNTAVIILPVILISLSNETLFSLLFLPWFIYSLVTFIKFIVSKKTFNS